MNSMNDEHFFDLAMMVIAGHASDAEGAELHGLLASQPELKAEFERLQADARIAKETLGLVSATESTAGELPAYARGRLQTKVRETLRRPPVAERKLPWAWRWFLVLAPVTAAVVLLFVFVTHPQQPVIQVAMLDRAGLTRGAATNAVTLLHAEWETAGVNTFGKADALEAWEKEWPDTKAPVAKVIFDPASAEVRLLIRSRGQLVTKTFPVQQDLDAVLRQAQAFINAQTGH
ncbi:MAG: hypothetical protein ACYDH9_19285 [Limisphaerales bacterium]